MRLRRILYYYQSVFLCHVEKFRKVRRLAEEVYGNEGAGARGNGLSYASGIKVPLADDRLHTHWPSTGVCHRDPCGDESMCRNDNFIARPDPKRFQCESNSIQAIANPNGMSGLSEFSKLPFKRRRLFAEYVPAAAHDPLDCFPHRCIDFLRGGANIEKGHLCREVRHDDALLRLRG